MLAPYPANRLHNQHPHRLLQIETGSPAKQHTGGQILHADWSAPLGADRMKGFDWPSALGLQGMKAMIKHRSHSAAFKRQVAQEFVAGKTLHGL
jgi:hypothetical protein